MITENDYVIDDDNYQDRCFMTEVDGHPVSRNTIPRDFEVQPVLSSPGAVSFSALNDELPLIPWEEMPERIAEKIAKKQQLSDIRNRMNNGGMAPSYDQNGQGFCVTEDTEILTQNGFVPYPDYNWTDPVGTVNPVTHAMEFQVPFQRHVYEYDGPMIYSSNRRIDFGVTPDHQMYLRKWDERKRTLSDQYSFVRAGDIGWYAGLMHAPDGQIGTDFVKLEVPGDRQYSGDDFFALLGLIISDGFAGGVHSEKTRSTVSFCSFRPELRESIASLATRNGFHESPSRPGVWVRYDALAFANWLRAYAYEGGLTGARAKKIPDLVKDASQRQINLFLDWFDDRNRDRSAFYSTSKRLIDDLQELHLRIGVRTSIESKRPKVVEFQGNASGTIKSGPAYVLHVSKTDSLCIDKKKHIETERYKGLVYCAAVPNHTLITRRNGSVLISSNCWFYSVTSATTLLRGRDNLPYVRLSAHAGACLIKNFRDQGGWGAHGLEFAMAKGIPSIEFWPEKSMDRRHNTPETWANAMQYRPFESFVDLDESIYERDMMWQQHLTLLLSNIPVIADRSWWRHSTCDMDVVDADKALSATDPMRYGVRTWNSWRDSWGTKGTGVIRGNKARASGATAPRAVVFSA